MDIYDTVEFDSLLDELLEEDFLDSNSDSNSSSFLSEQDCLYINFDDDGELKAPKPRRKRHRIRKRLPSYPGPVVVKHDIRRSYFNMLTNVLNTGDIGLLYGFLDTFLVVDALSLFMRSVDGVVMNDGVLSLTGIFQTAQQWCNHLAMAPDSIFSTKNCTIEYHTGKITGAMTFTGTKLYEDESLKEGMQDISWVNNEHHELQLKRQNITNSGNEVVLRKIMMNAEGAINKLIRRQTLEIYSINVKFVLTTDSEKRITRMELIAEC